MIECHIILCIYVLYIDVINVCYNNIVGRRGYIVISSTRALTTSVGEALKEHRNNIKIYESTT